jgi:hypothetical protein
MELSITTTLDYNAHYETLLLFTKIYDHMYVSNKYGNWILK